MALHHHDRRCSWPPFLAVLTSFFLGAEATALPQACQTKQNAESTVDGDASPGSDIGKTERITIIEDPDDPEVWATVGSFARDPSSENAAKAFKILEEVLVDWSSHPPGMVTTVLDSIAEHRLEAGRKYVIRFARTDPERPNSATVIRAATRALGAMGGSGAFEELAALAQHGSPEVVSTVAVALGNLGDPRAVVLLEGLARRPETAVRQRSLSALAVYCVGSSMSVAVENTKHTDSRVRNSATWWLSQCGTPEHAELLASLVDDADSLVRGNALKGLLRLSSKRACGRVPVLLADESLTVVELAGEYEKLCGAR